MDKNQEKEVFVEIDIIGTANILSEEAWEEQTKQTPEGNLYETVVDGEGNTKRQVTSFWAKEFFSMRRMYLGLLNSFARKKLTDHQLDDL